MGGMTPEQRAEAADLCPRMAEAMGWTVLQEANLLRYETDEHGIVAELDVWSHYGPEVLAFAMYVQAWAGKKGWRNFGSPAWSQEYGEIRMAQAKERPRRGTWAHKFDPTDEISHALAIVRCGLEIAAIGGEG